MKHGVEYGITVVSIRPYFNGLILYPSVHFHEGLPELSDEVFFDGRKPSVLVIDDLVPEANQLVANILTKISHHRNISVLYITQHVLDKNKYARTISLNAHHLVLYKSPRDASQFATLARQMYPNSSKFAVERRTLIRRLYRMAIC